MAHFPESLLSGSMLTFISSFNPHNGPMEQVFSIIIFNLQTSKLKGKWLSQILTHNYLQIL